MFPETQADAEVYSPLSGSELCTRYSPTFWAMAASDGEQQGLERASTTPTGGPTCRPKRRWGGQRRNGRGRAVKTQFVNTLPTLPTEKDVTRLANKRLRKKFLRLLPTLEWEVRQAWERACAATPGQLRKEKAKVVNTYLCREGDCWKTRPELFMFDVQDSTSSTSMQSAWPFLSGRPTEQRVAGKCVLASSARCCHAATWFGKLFGTVSMCYYASALCLSPPGATFEVAQPCRGGALSPASATGCVDEAELQHFSTDVQRGMLGMVNQLRWKLGILDDVLRGGKLPRGHAAMIQAALRRVHSESEDLVDIRAWRKWVEL